MRRLLLSLLLLAPSLPASAQLAVYGEFSAANFGVPNTGWQYGTTFGIYKKFYSVPFFALDVDGRGQVVGGSASIASGLVGPRLVFKPHIFPVMPYVEALGGVGHAEYGQGSASTTATKFEYNFVGGIDLTILPRIDWRVAEFSYGGLSAFNGSFHPRTLSTGIVLRLP